MANATNRKISCQSKIRLSSLWYKAAGPNNLHTLPDFGNYPVETMYQSLEKILPHAYMVSAKAAAFNEDLEHVSYDFDRCVRLAEQKGFKGVYCVEQWSRDDQNVDYEKVGDWLIEHVKRNIQEPRNR